MYKSISKTNKSTRYFKAYKEWHATQSDYSVITAYTESGLFSTASSAINNGYYVHPLYKSIQAKYYSSDGNTITQYGEMKNPLAYNTERNLANTIYVIKLDQTKVGEKIKNGSVQLIDNDNSTTYIDDSYGNIVLSTPSYVYDSYNTSSNEFIISDSANTFAFEIVSITGSSAVLYSNITDLNYNVTFDTGSNIVYFDYDLYNDRIKISQITNGNVFYSDGLIVMTNGISFSNYDLYYRSTQTIYENEILVTAKTGEFNTSQNPTAVTVTVSGSYDFVTTAIQGVEPARTYTITEYTDIKKKESFVSSYSSSISGSWNDYTTYRTTDYTGSYLAPYITTIGLYDKDGDLVVVGKLAKPIKNLPDYDINFIVKFDT